MDWNRTWDAETLDREHREAAKERIRSFDRKQKRARNVISSESEVTSEGEIEDGGDDGDDDSSTVGSFDINQIRNKGNSRRSSVRRDLSKNPYRLEDVLETKKRSQLPRISDPKPPAPKRQAKKSTQRNSNAPVIASTPLKANSEPPQNSIDSPKRTTRQSIAVSPSSSIQENTEPPRVENSLQPPAQKNKKSLMASRGLNVDDSEPPVERNTSEALSKKRSSRQSITPSFVSTAFHDNTEAHPVRNSLQPGTKKNKTGNSNAPLIASRPFQVNSEPPQKSIDSPKRTTRQSIVVSPSSIQKNTEPPRVENPVQPPAKKNKTTRSKTPSTAALNVEPPGAQNTVESPKRKRATGGFVAPSVASTHENADAGNAHNSMEPPGKKNKNRSSNAPLITPTPLQVTSNPPESPIRIRRQQSAAVHHSPSSVQKNTGPPVNSMPPAGNRKKTPNSKKSSTASSVQDITEPPRVENLVQPPAKKNKTTRSKTPSTAALNVEPPSAQNTVESPKSKRATGGFIAPSVASTHENADAGDAHNSMEPPAKKNKNRNSNAPLIASTPFQTNSERSPNRFNVTPLTPFQNDSQTERVNRNLILTQRPRPSGGRVSGVTRARSGSGTRRSMFDIARGTTAVLKNAQVEEKIPERYVGDDVFGNYHMLEERQVTEILNRVHPDHGFSREEVKLFALRINHTLEDLMVHLCESTKQPYGFVTFNHLLRELIHNEVLPKTTTGSDLVERMRQQFSQQDFRRSEGILYPRPFNSDTANYLA